MNQNHNKSNTGKLLCVYRISDAGRIKPKLEFADKKNCLLNFLFEFKENDIIVVADNCSTELISWLKSLNISIIQTALGNTGSFVRQLQIAVDNIDKYQSFYFVEDDYLHKENSSNILDIALQNFGYVTLYNHPDKWLNLNGTEKLMEKTGVYRAKNHLFFNVRSTTLTFACRGDSLRRDLWIWKMSRFFKGIPRDYLLWEIVTGSYPLNGNVVPLTLRRLLWFLLLLRRPAKLCCPLRGYATHTEIKELDNSTDWSSAVHLQGSK